MKTLSVKLVRKANSFTSEARKSGKWIISEHATRPESRIDTRGIFRKHYAQGSCKKSILLVRLALFCVMVHGFGPNLAAFGPKLDLTF